MLSPGLWPSFSYSGPVKDGPSIIYMAGIQAERVEKSVQRRNQTEIREFEKGGTEVSREADEKR